MNTTSTRYDRFAIRLTQIISRLLSGESLDLKTWQKSLEYLNERYSEISTSDYSTLISLVRMGAGDLTGNALQTVR